MEEIDKIFESIGYKIKKENNGYIRYWQQEHYGDEISFKITEKKVRKISRGLENPHPKYITTEELKAIEQFYKEMGW